MRIICWTRSSSSSPVRRLAAGLAGAALAALAWTPPLLGAGQARSDAQGFSFKSAVDLVNVTATVTDGRGHFVSGLRAEDFVIYEDGQAQTISQFDAERVPVSLGIALDTSGSMQGEKMSAARQAVSRFVLDLLGSKDQMFLYRFDRYPSLVQGWTDDGQRIVRALESIRPSGETALYDAVAEAVPLATQGTRPRKALLVISDGNDTNSEMRPADLQRLIRQSEVLVYAIGIDGSGGGVTIGGWTPPVWLPIPGRRPSPSSRGGGQGSGAGDRVNADALRLITDDSGGRTEIITAARDLDRATSGIADELSRQYFLGYVSTRPKDGRWHSIEVRLRRGDSVVRARKGYIAD